MGLSLAVDGDIDVAPVDGLAYIGPHTSYPKLDDRTMNCGQTNIFLSKLLWNSVVLHASCAQYIWPTWVMRHKSIGTIAIVDKRVQKQHARNN